MSDNRAKPSRTFLRPSEVASLFNVSVYTVYLWYRMERIAGIKIGGCLRIYGSSLGGISRRQGKAGSREDSSPGIRRVA
jgi:hypothetical protein